MEDNSRNQNSRDRQADRTRDTDRSKQDNRRNTTSGNPEDNGIREVERRDRLTTTVPDNYERDSE